MATCDGSDDASPNHGFRGLRVWQEAVALEDEVERIIGGFPSERASLADQMRRAARSVHANIAEGSGRHTKREFARALDIARGSLRELESDVLGLERLALADHGRVTSVHERVKRVGRLLAGLIRYLRPPDAKE
jgi:four helix bundle protein